MMSIHRDEQQRLHFAHRQVVVISWSWGFPIHINTSRPFIFKVNAIFMPDHLAVDHTGHLNRTNDILQRSEHSLYGFWGTRA